MTKHWREALSIALLALSAACLALSAALDPARARPKATRRTRFRAPHVVATSAGSFELGRWTKGGEA